MSRARQHFVSLVAAAVLAAPAAAHAATEARRFAVVAGANRGSPDRVLLRYAVTDAERFAGVLTRMGGVAPADLALLREPSRQAILAALASMRAQAARTRVVRTEVVLYYSGHADEKGLLLGRETIGYRELKEAMDGMGTDVSIAVLDACGSGMITRLKGGVEQPGFLADVSSSMQGRAFLTSSSENEAAQESDNLRGSYFTHALVSGLRGAADASGDGKVTLGEAYQFAFQETLAQTTTTPAGAQHPALDIRMAGTGDVVMTDVRRHTSTLVLGPDFDGRFYVKNANRHLVAELYKPAGRTVELGLEPGRYAVEFLQDQRLMAASVAIADGQHLAVERRGFRDVPLSPGVRRGSGPVERAPGAADLSGRTRAELWAGLASPAGTVGAGLSHWIMEDVALELHTVAFDAGGAMAMGASGRSLGVLLGARWYLPSSDSGRRLRPYFAGSVGGFRDSESVASTGMDGAGMDGSIRGRSYVGGHLGGGVDALLGRRFSLSARVGSVFRNGHDASFTIGLGLGMDWGGKRPWGDADSK